MVPKYSVNLTGQLVGVIQPTKSVGRAIILKCNLACFSSMAAAPCLFNNRADEFFIREESYVQVQCYLGVMEDTFNICGNIRKESKNRS